MHFGRSHGRSKSRSPAPATDSQISTPQYSRPPAFLPPSHYAAAAGLPTAGDTRSSLEQYSPAFDHSSIAYPALDETPSPDSTETPSHFGAVGRLISRTSGKRSTPTLTRSDSKGDKDKDLRDKRKSQFGGLPLLEAHLLPSLRDTVDRMTQLPRSSIDRNEFAESYHAPTPPAVSTRIPRFTPEPSPATSIPRLRTQASPTPKSALKSPSRRGTVLSATPRLPSPTTLPKIVRTPREYSNPHQEPQPESGQGLMPRNRHERSRIAAGVPPSTSKPTSNAISALPKRKTDTRSKSNPTTPQNTHRHSVFATPQPERPTGSPYVYSSLPKLKPSRKEHILPNDSGSELERQVGRALSPGRLMVTNAMIVPSSSESDHETKTRNRRSQWLKQVPPPPPPAATSRAHSRQPSRAQMHRDACVVPVDPPRSRSAMAVGLGLKVDDGFSGYRRRFPIDDDEASIYEDESDSHSLIMDEPPLAEDVDDDGSIYADDLPRQDSFRQRSPLPPRQVSSGDQLRREALLGIVDGLHRDYGATHGNDDDGVPQSESEDGSSFHGLAISGSADMQNASSTASNALPRTPLLRGNGNVPCESEASHSDDESTYSDHDFYDTTQTGNSNDYRFSPRQETRNARSAVSLRQNRTSWKRPSSELDVHEHAPSDRRSPSLSSQAADSRRSRSPLLASSIPREPAVDAHFASGKPHKRSKSGHERTPTSRRDSRKDATNTSKRNSHQKQATESSSRSSRHLSPSPRPSHGSSHRQQDTSAHERLGFGIPESLSYGGNTTPDESEAIQRPPLSRVGSAASSAPGISRADSDLSVADAGWQDQVRISRELSKGAAALFDALESKTAKAKGGLHRHYGNEEREQDRTPLADHGSWDSPRRSGHRAASSGIPSRHPRQPSPDAVSLSTASSPPSEYEEHTSPVSEPEPEEAPLSPPQVLVHEPSSSWKSTLSADVYCTLSRHYGHEEMERQELIYSFCTSESAFVKSARRVVRTVLLPLRARESRAWLPGLPVEIARLFDWIEDIVNLHAAIARALSTVAAIWQTGSIVQRVAGTLKGFVPRLETYMPYLAKFEGMKEAVRWHAEQDGGEFGEYLRMAERERLEEEWPLEKLFDEPYARLRSYLDVFQRLYELTPRGHPDYLATTSLLYSTRTAVRVMEEVKAREEEYDFVKDLSSRIDGLPVTQALARRSRRLLWFGMLVQVEDSPQPDKVEPQPPGTTPAITHDFVPRSNQNAPRRSQELGDRNSVKLATAIRDWTARRSRVGSFGSSASSTLSVQTFDTTSTASSASLLATPRSNHFPGIHPPGRAGSKGHARSPQVARANLGTPWPPQAEDVPLNVMVFSDLVVLAVPNASRSSGGTQDDDQEQRSRLINGIGLSRILGVIGIGERCVCLSLIPIPPDQLDTGITVENTSPIDITLSLPPSVDPTSKPDDLVKALRKCYHHTVRGLSYPALPAVITDDLELDTRQSLVGILSAGLPLPKSPSMQFDTAAQGGDLGEHGGKEEDRARGEREERGWWTLRFQQVLREFQREELPVAVAGEWAAASLRD